jgi:hypothetical protein
MLKLSEHHQSSKGEDMLKQKKSIWLNNSPREASPEILSSSCLHQLQWSKVSRPQDIIY